VIVTNKEKMPTLLTMELIGEVKGRNVILSRRHDRHGGTLAKAADLMIEKRCIERKSNLYTCHFRMTYEK
jgi:hypothetical protein